MRHGMKKIKFKQGKDANKALMRKLMVNFITHGKIQTTIKKAKVLKSEVERFVEKTKVETEANKNNLLKMIGDSELVKKSFEQIGKPLKDKIGGYVRVVRLGMRDSDGTEMAKLEWAYPVVREEKIPKRAKEVKKNGSTNTINKTG